VRQDPRDRVRVAGPTYLEVTGILLNKRAPFLFCLGPLAIGHFDECARPASRPRIGCVGYDEAREASVGGVERGLVACGIVLSTQPAQERRRRLCRFCQIHRS